MKAVILGFFCAACSLNVSAQSFEQPTLKPGDAWTYRNTSETGPNGWQQSQQELTVTRGTATSIYLAIHQKNSTQPPKNIVWRSDWSRVRDVNGTETVVNQPLAFPLSVGKTWQLQYKEMQPNKRHRSEAWSSKYTVVGFETIEVPAGKFNALKIEAEGTWVAEMEPSNTVIQGVQNVQDATTMVTQVQKNGPVRATGRVYRAFWYVPEVKRWVKSVEEYYGNGADRTERSTSELESFSISK